MRVLSVVVPIFVGILLVGLGLYMRPVVPEGWATADGTVVTLSADGATTSGIAVTYTTSAGEQRTLKSSFTYGGPGSDRVGNQVRVAYDPHDPSHEKIVGGAVGWVWLGPLVLGVVLVSVGAYRLVRR